MKIKIGFQKHLTRAQSALNALAVALISVDVVRSRGLEFNPDQLAEVAEQITVIERQLAEAKTLLKGLSAGKSAKAAA